MEWLTRNITALFEWLWDNFISLGQWLGEFIVNGIQVLLRHVQVLAAGLLATVAGVVPGESLADTWSSVLSSLTWLNGWPLYVLHNCFSFDFALARLTYFIGLLLAAYALRISFSAARAALDLF